MFPWIAGDDGVYYYILCFMVKYQYLMHEYSTKVAYCLCYHGGESRLGMSSN